MTVTDRDIRAAALRKKAVLDHLANWAADKCLDMGWTPAYVRSFGVPQVAAAMEGVIYEEARIRQDFEPT